MDDNYLDDYGHNGTDESSLCPVCGAYSPRSCEMRDEAEGECPWQMMIDAEAE